MDITLVATDITGHSSISAPQSLILPQRQFSNPVAAALVSNRARLMVTPNDHNLRLEAANLMAGVAKQPTFFHGDPVVEMALRSGAVRLVLARAEDSMRPIADILWQVAVRVEEGKVGVAEKNLRAAQHELAAALNRNAGEVEVSRLAERLNQALSTYMKELTSRLEERKGDHPVVTTPQNAAGSGSLHATGSAREN